ncbi:hypothetical protein T8K17_18170 [Thalassobaculum sp. OXR-137]|uniref:hypothetical protein n=1 Tax=Thalassobaculum sp. OXR-137 TaxID=3100173 RepID=UPI002AC9C7B8|nr:hypothetical protein [Thalassobaculum sp. OXR-137]WPZ33157.1 hypothetical protein T8K17_18170 [Thalassobaculum sp. OXR-137]
MAPKVKHYADNSQTVTLSIEVPADLVEAVAQVLEATVDALRRASPEIGKSAADDGGYADVPDSAAKGSAYLSDRRQRTWLLYRFVRRSVTNQAIPRTLEEIIAEAASLVDFDDATAQQLYQTKRKVQNRKLRRRRDREISRLACNDDLLTTTRIARLIRQRRVYGDVSQSTVSRVLQAAERERQRLVTQKTRSAVSRLVAATTFNPGRKAQDAGGEP